MKLTKGTSGQLFWATPQSPESEANSVRFQTIADGRFHEYQLDLGAAKTWKGRIRRLRLDPNDDSDSDVAVDYVRFR